MGFSRQECWSGLPVPSPGGLSNPGIKPGLHCRQILYQLSYKAMRYYNGKEKKQTKNKIGLRQLLHWEILGELSLSVSHWCVSSCCGSPAWESSGMYSPRVNHLIGWTSFIRKSAGGSISHRQSHNLALGESSKVIPSPAATLSYPTSCHTSWLGSHPLPLGGWLTGPLEESGTARKEGCWTYEPVDPVHEDPSAATSGWYKPAPISHNPTYTHLFCLCVLLCPPHSTSSHVSPSWARSFVFIFPGPWSKLQETQSLIHLALHSFIQGSCLDHRRQVTTLGPLPDTNSRLLQESLHQVIMWGHQCMESRHGSSRSRIHEPKINSVLPPPAHRHTAEEQELKQHASTGK